MGKNTGRRTADIGQVNKREKGDLQEVIPDVTKSFLVVWSKL